MSCATTVTSSSSSSAPTAVFNPHRSPHPPALRRRRRQRPMPPARRTQAAPQPSWRLSGTRATPDEGWRRPGGRDAASLRRHGVHPSLQLGLPCKHGDCTEVLGRRREVERSLTLERVTKAPCLHAQMPPFTRPRHSHIKRTQPSIAAALSRRPLPPSPPLRPTARLLSQHEGHPGAGPCLPAARRQRSGRRRPERELWAVLWLQ